MSGVYVLPPHANHYIESYPGLAPQHLSHVHDARAKFVLRNQHLIHMFQAPVFSAVAFRGRQKPLLHVAEVFHDCKM